MKKSIEAGDSVSKILLITEGEKTEDNFYGKMLPLFGINADIYHFKTNYISLYKSLIDNDGFENDLIDVLRTRKNNTKEENEILQNDFTYIYLVFDLDLHSDSKGEYIQMFDYLIKRFDNETEDGKIYINYPMMESYRDQKVVGEADYLEKSILVSESSSYKSLVNLRGNCINISSYKKEDFSKIISQNFLKITNLLNFTRNSSLDEYFIITSQYNIFHSIVISMINNGYIPVLNTCCFLPIDFIGINAFKDILK